MRKRLLTLLLAGACAFGLLSAAAPEADASWSSVEEFRAYALANWSRPLLAETNPVGSLARFGTSRDGRRHAAIDIGVTDGAGTPVYAMTGGTVIEYCPNFYYGTSSIGVENTDGSVLRYCEISTSLTNGDTVEQGQIIGYLIPNHLYETCMLHLELYLGTRTGALTNRDNYHYDYVPDAYYARRADLLDPTFLLNISRFTGAHEHIWDEDGRCVVCGRHWTEYEDPTLHAAGFADVTVDDYCYDAVLWAVDENVSSGATAALFGADAICTRAQAATLLWRAAGSPVVDIENPFTDVLESDYCYDAVRCAAAAGITEGVSADEFDPDGLMTRAQVLIFMWRAAGAPVMDEAIAYEDVPDGAYYHETVEWAVASGIAGGTGPTTFGPAEMCTRGQLITFLYRAYGD